MSAQHGSVTPTQTARRRDLIEATISAISEHGLSNLTLNKVAAGAGLTAGSVNFHFTSKDQLLLATLQHVSDEFAQAVEQAIAEAGDDPGAALAALARANLDPALTEPRKLAVWYAFIAESHSRAEYQRICGARDDAYFDLVLSLCRRLTAEREEVDAEALAYGFVGLIEALWQDILFDGAAADRAAALRICLRFLASVFPGRFEMAVQPQPRPSIVELPGPALAPVQEGGLAYTLPSWIYGNEEFFALERERIFLPSWQLVCHLSDIPEPGRYVTFDFLGERSFVIRDNDGAVRAFHNVCRHRAHAVVDGQAGSCRGMIQCPYHGWTYNLDGSNRSVSASDTFARFDRSRFGLQAIDVEVFLGFVFIRFRSGGPPVAERFAPVREEFERYRTAGMQRVGSRETDAAFWTHPVEMDWKNGIENYVEDYHFPTGHRGLSALMEREYDRDAYDTGLVRLSHQMREQPLKSWSVQRYHKLLPDYGHLPESMRRRWTYYALFPNTFFDLFPEQMDVFQILPTGPGRAVLRGANYALPDDSRATRAARFLSDRINVQVQEEDNGLTESVQRGLASSAYEVGILSSRENMVRSFQDWVRERLPVSRLLHAPPAGTVARHDRALSRTGA